MKCSGDYGTHHGGCECHEAKWQRVAQALRDALEDLDVLVSHGDLDWVEKRLRRIGLVRRDGKWEFIDA